MGRIIDRIVWSLVLLLMMFLTARVYVIGPENWGSKIDASDFYEQVKAGKVVKVTVRDNVVIAGEYKSGEEPNEFRTYCPLGPDLYPDLGNIFKEKNVAVYARTESLMDRLWYFWPLIFIAFLALYLYYSKKRRSNDDQDFGKSRAKLISASQKTSTTFNDVAGAEEAKQELQEVVDFLKDPKDFEAMGARIPRGILLVGPTGTGKTLLARAVAGQAGVPFFSMSGSEFVEMYVGIGASRVRDLFEQAKRNKPSIIFIDEIDAVGRHRGAGMGESHDEREQTLNQILIEMDGFDQRTNVIVMAATNRPDILDPALLRPGRFDRRIAVDRPDIRGRKAILEIHAKSKPLAQDVDLETVARETVGFTGADLANVLNEAAILAVRRKKKKIGMSDLYEAIVKSVFGPRKKSRIISLEEKKAISYHVTGHALVAFNLPEAQRINRISFIPQGTGEQTRTPIEGDRLFLTDVQLKAEITVLLAGRVAEEVSGLSITTEAANDMQEATDLARRMITEYGMSQKLGSRTFGRREEPVFLGKELIEEERNYSEKTAETIDEEVGKIITEAHEKAKGILVAKQPLLKNISERLIDEETLEGTVLQRLLG